jgi:zinc finger protein
VICCEASAKATDSGAPRSLKKKAAPRFPHFPNPFLTDHLAKHMVRMRLDEAICPACGGLGLDYNAQEVDLPFLGTSLETLMQCEACGYRHTDFVLTDVHEPTRVTYRVATGDDMMVRVVRSSSGTIRIPELGITIEPGVASEAFISNVEGVLVRVERVLDQLGRDAEDPKMVQRIMGLQETLGLMREGNAPPVTLILEDPFGNSRILAEGAVVEAIPPEEAANLKVGMLVFDPEGKLVRGD